MSGNATKIEFETAEKKEIAQEIFRKIKTVCRQNNSEILYDALRNYLENPMKKIDPEPKKRSRTIGIESPTISDKEEIGKMINMLKSKTGASAGNIVLHVLDEYEYIFFDKEGKK